MAQTKYLGELLVSRGLLKDWQLAAALQEQTSTKEFLGHLLVRKGWITEEVLLEALGEQLGIPYVRLDQEPIDWTVTRAFSPDLLKERVCFPFRLTDQGIMIAIANPLDVLAVSELEQVARPQHVQLVLASSQSIRAAIQRAYQDAVRSLNRPAQGTTP